MARLGFVPTHLVWNQASMQESSGPLVLHARIVSSLRNSCRLVFIFNLRNSLFGQECNEGDVKNARPIWYSTTTMSVSSSKVYYSSLWLQQMSAAPCHSGFSGLLHAVSCLCCYLTRESRFSWISYGFQWYTGWLQVFVFPPGVASVSNSSIQATIFKGCLKRRKMSL